MSNPRLVHTAPNTEYVDGNYEVTSNLAELISDYVDYGKSKARSEELAAKLGVPGRWLLPREAVLRIYPRHIEFYK